MEVEQLLLMLIKCASCFGLSYLFSIYNICTIEYDRKVLKSSLSMQVFNFSAISLLFIFFHAFLHFGWTMISQCTAKPKLSPSHIIFPSNLLWWLLSNFKKINENKHCILESVVLYVCVSVVYILWCALMEWNGQSSCCGSLNFAHHLPRSECAAVWGNAKW